MAVKTYKFDDATQLSPHFNVQEFRCKCSQHHDILIAEELVDKLERLYVKLDCSKIIITSGMRCSSYDISIGGNGGGQHPLGKAADVICYNQAGERISSKLVCCTAQDLGFGGIATRKLVESVELDKDTKKEAFIAFDFDLNVYLDSVQVAVNETGVESNDSVNPWAFSARTGATGTVTNSGQEITSISWS